MQSLRTAAFDYIAVGHVTIDVLADGSRRPGGSAFYSGLQAARLGQRTLIFTRGAKRELEQLLEPYRAELQLRVLPARETTTLVTTASPAAASAGQRRQRVLAWAGPIAPELAPDTSILHLAPVARETPRSWHGRVDFVGLTPQGLARGWRGHAGEMTLLAPDPGQLPDGCDAIVLSEHERDSCAALLAAGREAGAVAAVTAGAAATTVLLPSGEVRELPVPALARPRDDLGAGDVFAAAFFVALREGRSPVCAAGFANAAAGVRIGGVGAEAIGDRTAIEARLRGGATEAR
jgi:sugar/nucleoside kinase (ribokinase family)